MGQKLLPIQLNLVFEIIYYLMRQEKPLFLYMSTVQCICLMGAVLQFLFMNKVVIPILTKIFSFDEWSIVLFLLDKYLQVELLDYRWTVFLSMCKTARWFPEALYPGSMLSTCFQCQQWISRLLLGELFHLQAIACSSLSL